MWFAFAETQPPSPQDEYVPESEDDRDDPNVLLLSLLPWGVSLLLHVGLVLLAVFVVWSVQRQVTEEEIIIPIARLSATPGAQLQVRQQQRTTTSSAAASSAARRSVAARATTAAAASLSTSVSTSMEGLSIGQSISMGQASPFDVGVRGAEGMTARFFGSGGNAVRLAYLVDASGSLIDTLPFVILELKRSIGELSERQEFTVIFFQGEEALEVPPRGLKKATGANKQRVNQWLDAGNVVPMGQSSPVRSLRLALQYRPQLLFLLSDNITGEGRYEVDQRHLLAEIQQANRAGTKINTIQFLYQDKLVDYGMLPTMEMISRQSGGVYKFLDGRELGIQ